MWSIGLCHSKYALTHYLRFKLHVRLVVVSFRSGSVADGIRTLSLDKTMLA